AWTTPQGKLTKLLYRTPLEGFNLLSECAQNEQTGQLMAQCLPPISGAGSSVEDYVAPAESRLAGIRSGYAVGRSRSKRQFSVGCGSAAVFRATAKLSAARGQADLRCWSGRVDHPR